MIKLKYILFFQIFLSVISYSQTTKLAPKQYLKIDSLWSICNNQSQPDTSRLEALDIIVRTYQKQNPDTSIILAGQEILFAKKVKEKLFEAKAFNNLGNAFKIKKSYQKAIENYLIALKLFEKLHHIKGIKTSGDGLSQAYLQIKEYDNFFKYLVNNPLTYPELEKGIAWMYSGFFILFFIYNLFLFFFSKDKAYLYMAFSIFSFEIFNDFCKADFWFFLNSGRIKFLCFTIIISSNFIATYFFSKFFIEIVKSDKEHKIKEISWFKKVNSLILIMVALTALFFAIFSIFYLEHFDSLIHYFYLIVYYYDEAGTILLLCVLLILARIKLKYKLSYLNHILLGAALFFVGIIISEIGSNYAISFIQLIMTHSLGASLFLLLLSVEVAKKIKVFRDEKEAAQKNALQHLEEVVEARTFELKHQKHLVETKHLEITDSINYAERIQRSMLASKQMLNENSNSLSKGVFVNEEGYFVFFQPKDIVSGDFYWASKLNNERFCLVTSDSTGHGVPGAIMSMLNMNSLKEAITKGLTEADDILNYTRSIIINTLANDGSEQGGKDGMDCSLLIFDYKIMTLDWVGANNPVWIVRNVASDPVAVTSSGVEKLHLGLDSARPDKAEVIELKPQKMPVGKHERQNEPFVKQTFQLQKGDVIYAITDGYPDQFGGEKGKKFMSKNLKELLKNNSHLSMTEQKIILEQTFNNWKGDLEQVDDVTIIGIRV